MHNWRLLLLAFLAFAHPIASFTERSLVDGREQCCDRQSNNFLRDTRLSYGSQRLAKPAEDRRINYRAAIREDRRYEVRSDDNTLVRSADRRLAEYRSDRYSSGIPLELNHRYSRVEHKRIVEIPRIRISPERNIRARDSERVVSRAIVRDTRASSSVLTRDDRIRDNSRIRYSRESDIRQHDRDNRETRKLSQEHNRIVRTVNEERRSRFTMDARRESPFRTNSRERSVEETRETRNVLQRARDDVVRSDVYDEREGRGVVRERSVERRGFTFRSESRLHRDDKRDRKFIDRRIRDASDYRSSSIDSTIDQARRVRDDTRATRDERERFSTRRSIERLDERRSHRDETRASRDRNRDSRERSSEVRRYSRESVDRSRNMELGKTRLEHAGLRREFRSDERPVQYNREVRVPFESRRTEYRNMERETRQTRNIIKRSEIRSVDRLNRNSRFESKSIRSDLRQQRDEPIRLEYRITKNNMERGNVDSRIRSAKFTRSQEQFATIREIKTEGKAGAINLQYIFYTLHAIYLCGVLIQMLTENGSDKKTRVWKWLSGTSQNLVKVD